MFLKAEVRYVAAAAKSLQSCLTLCNPIDSSPSGSSVPGILQARILEWVAISFSKYFSVKNFAGFKYCRNIYCKSLGLRLGDFVSVNSG